MEYKITIDTREKQIDHITEQFDKNEIIYIRKKLSVGDYAVEIDGELIPIVIERKASIEELLSNLADRKSHDGYSNRFIRELIAAEALGYRIIILIENGDWYEDILKQKYRNKITPSQALGLILSLEAKFPNLSIVGIDKRLTASYINRVLRLHLQEYLKK